MAKVIYRVIVKARGVDVDEVIDEIMNSVRGIENIVCQYTEDFKHELDIEADPDEFKYYELEYYVDENLGDCELIDSWEY